MPAPNSETSSPASDDAARHSDASPNLRMNWPALRRLATKRGRAGYRRLTQLWPLIALGAVNAIIVFASSAPLTYVAAVAFGTLGVAIGVRYYTLSSSNSESSGNISTWMKNPRTIFWAIGGGAHTFLLVRILTEPTNIFDLLLWIAGIAAFGAPFIKLNSLRNLKISPPVIDIAIVAGLMVACIAIHSHDLRDWRYATIGDDIGFYLRVRQILEEGIQRPFLLQGVCHNSPMLNSIYQAFVSWVFGGGAWGWKFSSVISVAITVPAIYSLGYMAAGRISGVVAAAVLVSSHYVMAFTHIGYTHLEALPVVAWATLAFIIGSRTKSAPILFVSGIIAGLSLYVALPARVILPIFAAWAIINRMGARQMLALWPAALGFTVCALPFIVENRMDTILVMGIDLISPNSKYESEIGGLLNRLKTNLENNLLVWWWNPRVSHYTSGSLLDAASGILVILGIGIAVGKWRRIDKLIIVWLALTMIATAMLSPYAYTPITRMHSNLAPLALLCGVGVSVSLNWIQGYKPYKYIAVCALLMAILALNVWRFQVTTPNAMVHYTPESLAVKAWHSDECGRSGDTLFIGRNIHLMDLVLLTYIPEGERPKTIEYEDPLVLSPLSACKIFFQPDDSEAQQRIQVLTEVFPNKSTVIANPSGHSRVEIVK